MSTKIAELNVLLLFITTLVRPDLNADDCLSHIYVLIMFCRIIKISKGNDTTIHASLATLRHSPDMKGWSFTW